jgi:hypothetical protein
MLFAEKEEQEHPLSKNHFSSFKTKEKENKNVNALGSCILAKVFFAKMPARERKCLYLPWLPWATRLKKNQLCLCCVTQYRVTNRCSPSGNIL